MKVYIPWVDITKFKLEWHVNDEMFYLVEKNGDVVSTGATVSSCIDKFYSEQVYEKLRKFKSFSGVGSRELEVSVSWAKNKP